MINKNKTQYFDAFEEKPKEMLVLGPRFHPGNFAAPFGHTIVWDQRLDTIVLQSFNPSKFPRFYNSLMINARKIDRIAFTDYKESRLPVFDMEKIERTSVRKYWLMRACGRVICDFMNHASCNSEAARIW